MWKTLLSIQTYMRKNVGDPFLHENLNCTTINPVKTFFEIFSIEEMNICVDNFN